MSKKAFKNWNDRSKGVIILRKPTKPNWAKKPTTSRGPTNDENNKPKKDENQ